LMLYAIVHMYVELGSGDFGIEKWAISEVE
jgi:hypothetical protein